jgi:outer membrane biosynthesis protein TonB
MRVPLVISFGFHIAVFVFALYGLPSTSQSVVMEHRVIDVEIVSATETPEPTPVPKPAPPPTQKVKAPPPPKPPAPPKQVAALPPAPEPAPAPPSEPEPQPKPAEAKPEPTPPKPKAELKPKPAPPKVAPRPRPRPRQDFASMMLKTVQKLKDAPPPKKPQKKEKSFDEKMAALINRQSVSKPERAQQAPLGKKLTISEIDAIRRQIERCWLVPAAIGAKDVQEMSVQVRLKLNPDGTLRESRIVDRFRMETNATYKAVAESALRAIRNPRCSRFNLPLQKFDVWKDMVLLFNPSEMVGR